MPVTRRGFLKTAGAGTVGAAVLTTGSAALLPRSAQAAPAEADAAAAAWPAIGQVYNQPADYVLAFGDEFDGSAVDTSVWNYRTDQKGYSAQLPANVAIGNGVLTISLLQQDVGSYNYTGGGLVSNQAFRYGYFESRLRTTAAAGWHTSFWAQAGDGSDTYDAQRRTEIDCFEIDSATRSSIRHNVIPWFPAISGYSPTTGVYALPFDTSAGWHVYAFEWTEEAVIFTVDGTVAYVAPYPPSIDTHDPINIWLTCIATESPDASALPSQVEFDYVHCYQRDYYVDNALGGGYSETGVWENSTQVGYTAGTSSRYAAAAGATATWQPTLLADGTYDVYFYQETSVNKADPAQQVEVFDGTSSQTQTINGLIGPTGWRYLGTYDLPAGTSAYVKTTASAEYARSNAVRFLRA